MNMNELVDVVKEVKGGTKKDAKASIDAVLTAIGQVLARGEGVKLSGFGNFSVHQLNAGTARNPKTGEQVTVEERNTVRFKPSNVLKEAVNS